MPEQRRERRRAYDRTELTGKSDGRKWVRRKQILVHQVKSILIILPGEGTVNWVRTKIQELSSGKAVSNRTI